MTPKGLMPECEGTDLKKYLVCIDEAMQDIQPSIDKAIETLKNVILSGKKIWVLGNGGSLAIGQHFAQDLVKLRGIRAQAITCPSILTAYTNDDQFENCYSMPLEILGDNGDAVVIFSCSGKSRNYESILDNGWRTVSIVGTDGGFLKKYSNVCVHVKSENYQVCESAFSIVADLINYGMELKK